MHSEGGSPLYKPDGWASGKVAACAPAHSSAKRPHRTTRPWAMGSPPWESTPPETERRGVTAAAKPLICKFHQDLSDMMGHPIGALREKESRYKENKNGPLRNVAGDLFGLGVATVGR